MSKKDGSALVLKFARGIEGGKRCTHFEPREISWGRFVDLPLWQAPPVGAKDAFPFIFGELGDEPREACGASDLCYTEDGRHRTKANLLSRTAVTLDIEGPAVSRQWVDGLLDRLEDQGVSFLAHTTHSNGLPGKGVRWRLFMPLARPVEDHDEFHLICRAWATVAAGDKGVAGTFDPSGFHAVWLAYAPTLPDAGAEGRYRVRANVGTALDPQEWLDTADMLGLEAQRSGAQYDGTWDGRGNMLSYEELTEAERGFVDARLTRLRQRWVRVCTDALGWPEGHREVLPGYGGDGEQAEAVGWEGISLRMAWAYARHGCQAWSGYSEAEMGDLYERDLGEIASGEGCGDKWYPGIYAKAWASGGPTATPWPEEFLPIVSGYSTDDLAGKPILYVRGAIDIEDNLGYQVADEYLRGSVIATGTSHWAIWDGERWGITKEIDGVHKVVSGAIRDILREHTDQAWLRYEGSRKTSEDEKELNKVLAAAGEYLTQRKIRDVTRLARKYVHVPTSFFDGPGCARYLNVRNGVVDLQTGKLEPHSQELGFTRVSPVDYEPGARHPDWDKVLRAIPDDVLPWLKRKLGQACWGVAPPDDIAMFWKGGGENGKSTVIMGLKEALGPFYTVVSEKLLRKGGTEGPEVMSLKGARLAVIEELPEGDYVEAATLKRLVGTGTGMSGRHLYRELEMWDPTHALVFTTNEEVQITATDHGTWRRLAQVDFPYTFNGVDRERDDRLRDRVAQDPEVAQAALAWLVEGAVEAHKEGLSRADLPERVRKATEAWRLAGNDPAVFIAEHLELAPGKAVLSQEVYEQFCLWARERGRRVMTDKTFWTRADSALLMADQDVEKAKTRSGEGKGYMIVSVEGVELPDIFRNAIRNVSWTDDAIKIARERELGL